MRIRPSVRYLKYSPGLQFAAIACSHARHFRSSTRACISPEQTNYGHDPRLESLGKVIKDEYAVVRDNYGESYPELKSQ